MNCLDGKAADFIALAVPVFFLLIGLEVLLDRLRRSDLYRFNDAVTNISCGIGQQVLGAFLKIALLWGYTELYNRARLFEIPCDTWWSWVILFLGVDFFYYWFHRYAHEVSILWGGHIVHHQSEEYNLSVALRQGAFQSSTSWIFYLPLALIGFDPIMFVVVNQWVTLYQFWIHTRAIGKMWWPIELIFNTPSHHRVHHGIQPKYIDKNHAGMLIIWDRMFGTFQKEEEEVVYGVTKPLASWNPVWANFEYIWWMLRTAFQCKSLPDALRVFFKKPGWRPAYLGGPIEPKNISKKERARYDTVLPAGLNYYILFQYIITLGGTSMFLFTHSRPGVFTPATMAGAAALIILGILLQGAVLERRGWALMAEPVRLICTAAAIVWFFHGTAAWTWVITASSVWAGFSLGWLLLYRNIFLVSPNNRVAGQPSV